MPERSVAVWPVPSGGRNRCRAGGQPWVSRETGGCRGGTRVVCREGNGSRDKQALHEVLGSAEHKSGPTTANDAKDGTGIETIPRFECLADVVSDGGFVSSGFLCTVPLSVPTPAPCAHFARLMHKAIPYWPPEDGSTTPSTALH